MASPAPFPEQFRDCVSDVLALAEAYLMIKDADGEQVALGVENLSVIMDNADQQGCLRVSVSMLACAWQLISVVRAEANGTTVDGELARMLTLFRSELGRLRCP